MSQEFVGSHFEGGSQGPAVLWLVAGLLLGGFAVLLCVLFLDEDKHTHHLNLVPRTMATAGELAVPSPVAEKVAQTQSAPAAKEPSFEFYQTLTEPAAITRHVPPVKENTVKKHTYRSFRYALQVASVTRFAEADRLKAELDLLGYEVIVRKVLVGKRQWYRISVGPYRDLRQAQQAKQFLSKNNIKSMMLKTES